MATKSPAEFIQEVRREVAKVTWPTRKETGVSTLMVFLMVAISAVFFLVVDLSLSWGVRLVLGIGG